MIALLRPTMVIIATGYLLRVKPLRREEVGQPIRSELQLPAAVVDEPVIAVPSPSG
jgi:hypothetical protein